MCILHLQNISVGVATPQVFHSHKELGGYPVRWHWSRPPTLLTCLILKITCITGTHVPILQTLLSPRELTTSALVHYPTLEGSPLMIQGSVCGGTKLSPHQQKPSQELPSPGQPPDEGPGWSGFPQALRATWPWHLLPCMRVVHPRRFVAHAVSTVQFVEAGKVRERLRWCKEPTRPWRLGTYPVWGGAFDWYMGNVNPLFPQASHGVLVSLLPEQCNL